jgi:hypothetical protein
MDPLQGFYPHNTTQTQKKFGQTSMPQAGTKLLSQCSSVYSWLLTSYRRIKREVSGMQSGRNMKMTTLHAVPKSRIRGALLHVPQYASMAWCTGTVAPHPTNTALILVPCCLLAKVRFPIGVRDFSLLHSVQTGSGAHPAFYPMGTWGSFLKDKVAEV